MVTALNIADTLIRDYGDELMLSNLKLNKLIYYAQAVMLRHTGHVLFTDNIEAWKYGPVEKSVYNAFSRYGSSRINEPTGQTTPRLDEDQHITIETIAKDYGKLTAFDLMMFSHRPGSAWRDAYQPDKNVIITPAMICASNDGIKPPRSSQTLEGGIKLAAKEHANALRMLENT